MHILVTHSTITWKWLFQVMLQTISIAHVTWDTMKDL
jgi:hypothetical protein